MPIVSHVIRSPFLLLMLAGLAFAGKLMVSKAALLSGIVPFQLGVLNNLGAGLVLLVLVRRSGERLATEPRHLRLYGILGLVGVGLPTVLVYAVIDRVGPAYTSTVYSLSPVLTMAFAAGVGVERLFPTRVAGILIGFAGIVVLVHRQILGIDAEAVPWVVLGLLIPVSAAVGNIVRTRFWPGGTSTLAFACATLLTSSVFLAAATPFFENPVQWRFADVGIVSWLGASIVVTATSQSLNFRLQHVAGPVVFSQIGYRGTGFGVVMSVLFFDNGLGVASLVGLVAIVAGGVLANRKPADAVRTVGGAAASPRALAPGPSTPSS